MKIAIGTSSFGFVDKTPLNLLTSKVNDVILNPYGRKLSEDEIIIHLKDIDGLIAGLEPLNYNVLKKCPNLKAIARVGIGMDNIDLKAASKLGIKISNTPDGPTESVAELTITAALTLTRSIISSNIKMHKKNWEKSISTGIKNLRVLIIGYGRIGKRVSKLLKIMGADVKIYDPYISQIDLENNEDLISLKKGLKFAQLITIHAAKNKKIISWEEFETMTPGVFILNSARGGLIDEKDLIKALDLNIVAGGWLDVFESEPYFGELTKYPQLLLTPHISTYTTQCRKDMEQMAVENLLKDLSIKT